MNKEYLKRSLILNGLGVEINKDIKELLDFLESLIDFENLKTKDGNLILSTGQLYIDNNIPIIFHDKENKSIFIEKDIWDKVGEKFNLEYDDICIILNISFEYYLNITTKGICWSKGFKRFFMEKK